MSGFGSLIQRLVAQHMGAPAGGLGSILSQHPGIMQPPQGIPTGMNPNAALGAPNPIKPQGIFNLGQMAGQMMGTPAAPQSPVKPGGFGGSINPQIAQLGMSLLQRSRPQPQPLLPFQMLRGGIR